jgi:peroxiredoxin
MPCKAELDALEKLKANGELTNVTVTAICVDKQADTLRSFLERRTMEFTVVHDPGFLERTGEGGVPVTLIIDGTGHIKDVLTGWSDSANDSEALETLRKSLGLARG